MFEVKKKEQKEKSEAELSEILDSTFVTEISPEEAKEHIKKIEEFNGKVSYQTRHDAIEIHKEQTWLKLGGVKYIKLAVEIINNRLKGFNIKLEELGTEIQEELTNLSSGFNFGFDKINKLEAKINQKINELEADKKFKQIQVRVSNCSSEKELKEIEKEINDFITSDKIHYQKKVKEAQQMLGKLKVNTSSQLRSTNGFPWKVMVPIALLSVVLVVGIAVMKKRLRRKSK